MKPNREEALFALALTKLTDERAEFLARECGDDAALRERLEALLAAHDDTAGVLAEPAPLAAKETMKIEFADEAKDETVGQKIGRYKILEKVGEGGSGVVYVAEQTRAALGVACADGEGVTMFGNHEAKHSNKGTQKRSMFDFVCFVVQLEPVPRPFGH
jgi:hypothetical protein